MLRWRHHATPAPGAAPRRTHVKVGHQGVSLSRRRRGRLPGRRAHDEQLDVQATFCIRLLLVDVHETHSDTGADCTCGSSQDTLARLETRCDANGRHATFVQPFLHECWKLGSHRFFFQSCHDFFFGGGRPLCPQKVQLGCRKGAARLQKRCSWGAHRLQKSCKMFFIIGKRASPEMHLFWTRDEGRKNLRGEQV